ncbi:site-specific DNA-methyltransferase [Moraxella nasicaprae]|uniref:site-specific DNA-methyltransferase (adenine-specific) n=1 Tax=Moraxella nasicaprae TaxID=2904122 RepID=A0ABY6F6V4_9GAMM|nr:site-specific DNA-methyltransferase [Moraxella nasicaprae]
MHSLKSRLSGKIKLIYIDPPYNTSNDSFKYNDNFNHSSWLVFMKNRLEIAKELLADDGVIFVSIDENEHAYLKVLMDEIFGRNNFIGELIRKTKSTANDVKTGLNIQHEYVLIFAKIKENVFLIGDEKTFDNYKNPDNDPNGDWVSADPTAQDDGRKTKNLMEIKNPYTGKIDVPNAGLRWRFAESSFNDLVASGKIVFKKSHGENERGFIFKRYKNEVKSTFKLIGSLDTADNQYLNQVATKELIKLFDNKVFDFPKPESLFQLIIQSCTNENDIVLDYHLGSGTTCAVAHKMGRRWIGIEQMDYIEDITKTRLLKVLDGEQGGISKAVNWQGGGSFVYFELKKYNQLFVEQIISANNKTELNAVYRQMKENAFLKFWFEADDFKEWFKDDDDDLIEDLSERKNKLLEILDENQLYLNYADIDDARYQVSDADKALSKAFYGERHD